MKRKLFVAIAILMTMQSCSLLGFSWFRFSGSSYYRSSTGKNISISKDANVDNGDVVNFDVALNYDASNIVQIDFYWTYGIDDPKLWNYMPGQNPSYVKAGTDIDLSGEFIFNTAFTGLNWITLKGVAFKSNGDVIVDKIWFNIDNIGPDIDIEPRDGSYVKSLDQIIIHLADGGSEAGLDYDRTSILLKNSSGSSLALSNPSYDETGTFKTKPVRYCTEGDYEISIIGYDNIGNPSTKTSIVHVVSSSYQSPIISIVVPDWNGKEVKGTISFSYTSNEPLQKLIVDSSCYGESSPCVFGSFPSFDIPNPMQSGVISIDTTFTGYNPAYFRLFGVSKNGLSSTSNIVNCRIYNY